jgi:hypothetical protein
MGLKTNRTSFSRGNRSVHQNKNDKNNEDMELVNMRNTNHTKTNGAN